MREFSELRRRAPREGDDPRIGPFRANFRDDVGDRRDAPALELGRRQDAAQEIENLHRFRARRELARQIRGRSVDEALEQRREEFWLAIGRPRRDLVWRPATCDHVARDRPRRAAKADQRDVAGQRRFEPIERLEHRREPRPVGLFGELCEPAGVGDRIETGAFAGLERDRLAERVRDHQNVGKKDRRVEAEPPSS